MESAVQLPPSSINHGGESATDDAALLKRLSNIVGISHVLTGMERTRGFCTGFRFGHGPVVAVVRPGTLVEFVVHNDDPIHHEFIVGDERVHARHERGHESAHPLVPGEVSVGPNDVGATFFRFDEPGRDR